MKPIKYAACTSFNREGYELYGRKFLTSFVKYWDIPLVVWYEGEKPDIVHDNIEYYNLLSEPEVDGFIKENDLPACHGVIGRKEGGIVTNYRFQSVKFGKKVLALTKFPTNVDWWIWIDADVVTKKKVTKAFLETVCQNNSLISYLGRKDWDHSECGFVCYRTGHPVVRTFLSKLRDTYLSGDVYAMREWHDSYVFDCLRKQFSEWEWAFDNISFGVPGNHVWPETILGEYMEHNKGPKLKREAYT